MTDIELKQKLLSIIHKKKSHQWYSDYLKVPVHRIRSTMNDIIRDRADGKENIVEREHRLPENSHGYNFEKGEYKLNAYYDHAPTREDVIRDHKIDETKWKLSGYWSKQRERGYQISAFFTAVKEEEKDISEVITNLLQNYKSSYKPISEQQVLQNKAYLSPSCALLSLPDLHIDKLQIDRISTEKKIENYTKVLENLLYRSYKSHFLEEIVFVIGNDLYHSDTFQGTTTKGTPISTDLTFDEAYEVGFDLMVKSISKLKQFCKTLHILLIPGNHARCKEYYLGHALEVYFKAEKSIKFNRGSEDMKVHKYGETLLCFSHGNCDNNKLPLSFATSFYKEWGECKYKELILADKHHNSEKLFRSQNEFMGVRMRILPTVSGTDQWHQDNLFINSIQAGICLIYDKQLGKCSEFEHRI